MQQFFHSPEKYEPNKCHAMDSDIYHIAMTNNKIENMYCIYIFSTWINVIKQATFYTEAS